MPRHKENGDHDHNAIRRDNRIARLGLWRLAEAGLEVQAADAVEFTHLHEQAITPAGRNEKAGTGPS